VEAPTGRSHAERSRPCSRLSLLPTTVTNRDSSSRRFKCADKPDGLVTLVRYDPQLIETQPLRLLTHRTRTTSRRVHPTTTLNHHIAILNTSRSAAIECHDGFVDNQMALQPFRLITYHAVISSAHTARHSTRTLPALDSSRNATTREPPNAPPDQRNKRLARLLVCVYEDGLLNVAHVLRWISVRPSKIHSYTLYSDTIKDEQPFSVAVSENLIAVARYRWGHPPTISSSHSRPGAQHFTLTGGAAFSA
jgi:hypothetical protein